MTIAQALKEKNKKIALINKLWDRIRQYNSVAEGVARPYDIQETYDELEKESASLVELKTKIHAASAPVRLLIFNLSEIKNCISNLKGVSTTNGLHRDRYSSDGGVVMTATLNIVWKDSKIEQFESQIESIQEELDSFNHSTHI